MSVINYYVAKRHQLNLEAKAGKIDTVEHAKKLSDLYDECCKMEAEASEVQQPLAECLQTESSPSLEESVIVAFFFALVIVVFNLGDYFPLFIFLYFLYFVISIIIHERKLKNPHQQ